MDYTAGHDGGGRAVLLGLRYPYLVAVLFDQQGQLIEARIRPLEFEAPSVHARGPYITEDPFFQDRVQSVMQQWQDELAFSEGTAVLERFRIPELLIGIEDLPRHFQRFLNDPTEFSSEEQSNYPDIIREWQMNGNFVFWWGEDYYVDRDGNVS
jgi:hypothetical protein